MNIYTYICIYKYTFTYFGPVVADNVYFVPKFAFFDLTVLSRTLIAFEIYKN